MFLGENMIFASGVIEIAGSRSVDILVGELKSRGLEIDDIEEEKVSFQIGRNTMAAVNSEMNSLKGLDGIKNVHITYYSLEDGNEEPDIIH
jgi:hypothetical protein